jgi:hypothetical protein
LEAQQLAGSLGDSLDVGSHGRAIAQDGERLLKRQGYLDGLASQRILVSVSLDWDLDYIVEHARLRLVECEQRVQVLERHLVGVTGRGALGTGAKGVQ